MSNDQKNRNMRRNTGRGIAGAAGLGALGLFFLWACHLGPEDSKDTFDVVGNPAWSDCHAVRIVLLDEDGDAVDTLFNDSLASLDQLKGLDASKYEGGKGGVSIQGLNEDGSSCFEETRTFEKGGTKVQVIPVLDPGVAPESLTVDPATLVLAMGSPVSSLTAVIRPAHANPALAWSVDASGVVELQGLEDGKGNPAQVKPLKAGQGKVTVRSLKDTTKSFTVNVLVTDPGTGSIKIGRDTVILYVKGPAESLTVAIPPEYAGQKVEWRIADDDIATVDAQGRIKPVKEGETQVRATLNPSGLSDVALVQVRRDVPSLRVTSAKGAAVGGEIVFSATAAQEYGTLVAYRWDLLGDGTWDDTSTAGWSGDSVDLPAVKQKYDKEGAFTAKFEVTDSEGNTGAAQVTVDIGNQAPEIVFLRKDTTISVKDSISMEAAAKDVDGKVVWVGWDYEGDGQFDDTLAGDKAELRANLGHKYQEAGTYNAVFRAMDENGKTSQDTARIKVEFDAPTADAGPDITVTAGTEFEFSAKGTDKFGAIAKREIKVGSGEFVALSKQDTVLTAPAQPGVIPIIVRVTDDDGLGDVDTALVTVILSSNADLSGLELSGGAVLVPEFKPNAQSYAAQVAFNDSLVTVTPTVKVASTKIVVNAEENPSGEASNPVKLNLGNNPDAFHIIVTAADGSQREYRISIKRNPNSEATLAKLESPNLVLTPAFSPSVVEYADTVPQTVSSVTFKPTVASAGASLSFGDSAMTSGTFTGPRTLEFGENVFTFVVTAQDGKSKTTYRVRVLRLGRLIVLRKMGAAAPVVADSLDLPVDGSLPLSGGSYAGWKFLGWSVVEGSAELADSTANPTDVTLKSGFARLQAGFEMLRYTVDLDVKGCGKVSPGADSTYDYGSSPEYVLTPASGCRIRSVKLDGKDEPSAYDGVYTFVSLNANHTFAVEFVRTYTVEWKVAGPGTVAPASPVTVDSGARASFKLMPAAGYKVALNGVCTGNICANPRPDSTVVIDTVRANRSYSVSFVRGYKVTGTATAGAAVISPVDSLVDSGSTVTWKYSLGANYRLDSLVVNGANSKETSTGVYTVASIGKDTHVRLVTRRQYSLTVTYNSAQGSVNQSSRLVDSGTTLNFTATPLAQENDLSGGFRVDTVLVNGSRPTTTGTDNWSARSWTLANISANNAVRVTFRRFFKLTAASHAYHTVTPATANVDSGQSQVFTYTFNMPTGYYLQDLILYRVPVTQYLSGNILTLPSVTLGGTISANYSNLYTLTVNGYNACILPTVQPPCPVGQLCPIQVCILNGQTSASATVEYGTSMSVSGSSSNSIGGAFRYWSVSSGETVSSNPATVVVTSNLEYTAIYRPVIIIDPPIIVDPPILLP